MADAIKTESIDELVAFLVRKLRDPKKTEFIKKIHESTKEVDTNRVCELFDEWMNSEVCGKTFSKSIRRKACSLGEHDCERFAILFALDVSYSSCINCYCFSCLPYLSGKIEKKLFNLAYNEMIIGMRLELISIIDKITEEPC